MHALDRFGLVLDAAELVDDDRVVGEDALPDVRLAGDQRVHQLLRQLDEFGLYVGVRFGEARTAARTMQHRDECDPDLGIDAFIEDSPRCDRRSTRDSGTHPPLRGAVPAVTDAMQRKRLAARRSIRASRHGPARAAMLCVRGELDERRNQVSYARRLGVWDATMVVVGGVIGSGIFLTPAAIARQTGIERRAAARVGVRRRARADRRALLRRARRAAAERRRRLREPARGVRAHRRVRLRLEHAGRELFRQPRRGRDGVRAIRGGRARHHARRRAPVRGRRDRVPRRHQLVRHPRRRADAEHPDRAEARRDRLADRDRPRRARRAAADACRRRR